MVNQPVRVGSVSSQRCLFFDGMLLLTANLTKSHVPLGDQLRAGGLTSCNFAESSNRTWKVVFNPSMTIDV